MKIFVMDKGKLKIKTILLKMWIAMDQKALNLATIFKIY